MSLFVAGAIFGEVQVSLFVKHKGTETGKWKEETRDRKGKWKEPTRDQNRKTQGAARGKHKGPKEENARDRNRKMEGTYKGPKRKTQGDRNRKTQGTEKGNGKNLQGTEKQKYDMYFEVREKTISGLGRGAAYKEYELMSSILSHAVVSLSFLDA